MLSGGLPGLEDSAAAVLAVVDGAEGEEYTGSRPGDNPQERPAKTVNITVPAVHPVPPVVGDPMQEILELNEAGDVEPHALLAEELGLNPH